MAICDQSKPESDICRSTNYLLPKMSMVLFPSSENIFKKTCELAIISITIINDRFRKAKVKQQFTETKSHVRQKSQNLWKTHGTVGWACFTATGKSIHMVNGDNQKTKKTRDQILQINSQLITKLLKGKTLLFCYWKKSQNHNGTKFSRTELWLVVFPKQEHKKH